MRCMTPQQIAEFKLDDLVKLIHEFPGMFPSPSDFPFARKVATGFRANVERIYGLLALWLFITGLSVSGTQAACLAAWRASAKKNVDWWDENGPNGMTSGQLGLARKYFPKAYEDIQEWNKNHPKSKERGTKDLFVSILKMGGPKIKKGFESDLSAALIGTWTAFEVLVGDTWEHALNSRLSLVFTALDAKIDPNDSPDMRDRKTRVSFEFPIHKFNEPTFKPRKQMGTILRQADKWDFGKRGEARDAFVKTFPDSKRELKLIFDASTLRWLAHVRHILVHQAGFADKEFREKVADHPSLSKIQLRHPVILDGEILAELIRGMLSNAAKLLTFVNEWLKNNPA